MNETGNGTNNETGNGTTNGTGNGTTNETGNGTVNETGNGTNNETENGTGTVNENATKRNLSNIQLINIKLSIKFKPQYKYTQTSGSALSQVKSEISYISPSNTSILSVDYINTSSYNCAPNCMQCDNSVTYPNQGVCMQCISYYTISYDQNSCQCNTTSLTDTRWWLLSYDASKERLSTKCSYRGVMNETQQCSNQLEKYFSSTSIRFEIVPTTLIAFYRLKLTNGETGVSQECLNLLKAHLVLVDSREEEKNRFPYSLFTTLSNGKMDLRSTNLIYYNIDLTSIRSVNKNKCEFSTFNNFSSQYCRTFLAVYYNYGPSASTSIVQLFDRMRLMQTNQTTYSNASSSYQSSLLYSLKEYRSFIFYDLKTNLTLKTIFIEDFTNFCHSCEMTTDPGLMIRLCTTPICIPEMTNNTVELGDYVLVTVSYNSAEYLMEKELTEVRVYDGGTLMDFGVSEVQIGNIVGLRVGQLYLGEHIFKRFRVAQL